MSKAKDPTLDATNDVTPSTRSAIRRYALIAIPVFAVVAIFFLIFFPKIQVGLWINGLHSDEPEIRREMRQNLLDAAKEDDGVYDQLAEAIADESRGFNVRQAVVGLLISANRLSLVLDAYAEGSLPARTAILARMKREKEFKTYWADDPSLEVRETVRKWLQRDGDFTRSHAIQIALQLDMKDTIPMIRPLLTRSTSSTVHEDKKRDLLIASAAAVNAFNDCESLPHVAALAASDPSYLVRIRALQNTYAAGFGIGPCTGSFDEGEMQKLVRRALGDRAKEVRMAAMLILEKETRWAGPLSEELQKTLNGESGADMNGTERRHALHALISVRAPAFVEQLPLYFLDPNPYIRSSCANKSILFHESAHRMESCLIGMMRTEVESRIVFLSTMEALRQAAGKWHGLNKALESKASKHPAVFKKDLETLFDTGEMGAFTRAQILEGWFTWLALDLGLEKERLPAVIAAWKGFWAAADEGDVAGAEAALGKLESAPARLFTYENAWLVRNRK